MEPAPLPPDELLRRLGEAARDLLVPSESDFPLTPLRWGAEPPSPDALRAAQGLPADAPVEETTVDDFFAPMTEPADADDAARAEAARYRQVVGVLRDHLQDLRVYRIGRVSIDVLLLGRHASGAWLGLRTKLIET